MTIAKRLRVIWAAIRQDWHQERCDECGATWWADRRCVPSCGECLDCEDRKFGEWKREWDKRQSKGAA